MIITAAARCIWDSKSLNSPFKPPLWLPLSALYTKCTKCITLSRNRKRNTSSDLDSALPKKMNCPARDKYQLQGNYFIKIRYGMDGIQFFS